MDDRRATDAGADPLPGLTKLADLPDAERARLEWLAYGVRSGADFSHAGWESFCVVSVEDADRLAVTAGLLIDGREAVTRWGAPALEIATSTIAAWNDERDAAGRPRWSVWCASP